MCGCTGVANPACWLRRLRRCQIDCAVRRVPLRPMKSACWSAGAPSWARKVNHLESAVSASRPTGTLRRLLPLPSTWASADGRSIQPRAAALAATSSPVNSATRKPLL